MACDIPYCQKFREDSTTSQQNITTKNQANKSFYCFFFGFLVKIYKKKRHEREYIKLDNEEKLKPNLKRTSRNKLLFLHQNFHFLTVFMIFSNFRIWSTKKLRHSFSPNSNLYSAPSLSANKI